MGVDGEREKRSCHVVLLGSARQDAVEHLDGEYALGFREVQADEWHDGVWVVFEADE